MANQKLPLKPQQPAAPAGVSGKSSPNSIGGELAEVICTLKRVGNSRSVLGQLATVLTANITLEQKLMSEITDWATKEEADLATISTTLDGVVAGVTALDAEIAAFQNSPGTLSAADQAALDSIQASSKALVAKSAAISTTPPVAIPAP